MAIAGEQVVRVLFSEERLAKRTQELAEAVKARMPSNLLVVAIMKGSFMFAADLIRALHRVGLTPEVDFISLTSYRKSTTSSGKVDILRDLEMDVAGRNVLLVDDVLDSGRTLAFAKDLVAARGARRVTTCVLLDKATPRAVQVKADFAAFVCPPVYVVGYGMDMAYRFRELPYVGQIITP